MPGILSQGFVAGLNTFNQILSSGIAITAFSLLLYSLTFNLRNRVARVFSFILACVVLVFTAKAIGSSMASDLSAVSFWLHLQWVGIIFLPSTYFHFSDALLATTGRPSRGRRRWATRFSYLVSFLLLVTLPFSNLVGPVVIDANPAPYLRRTLLTDVFTLYYGGVMVLAWINLGRAYFRTTTQTTRRRMLYLLSGATAPAIGSYPFLVFGPGIAAAYPLLFWTLATLANLMVSVLVVVMAYAVAFFGVPWPDRVVKSRLFKWLMRGPVTASFALALTTLIRRAGALYGVSYSALVPIVMVGTILTFEFMITLLAPVWDRWLFFGKDREELNILQNIGDRLLTRNDLHQFLETVLASVRDRLQVPTAFIAAMNGDGLELTVQTGEDKFLDEDAMSAVLSHTVIRTDAKEEMFRWGNYLLVPLHNQENGSAPILVGVLGVSQQVNQVFDEEQLSELLLLSRRAALALQDRNLQQQVFQSLKSLTPQVEYIQRLRAATRYDSTTMLTDEELLPQESMIQWIRDALTHYWGGPRLTESPLLQLQVVKAAVDSHEGNPANALRAILREAIDRTRPEGERRFTGEWILYNILEMKFLEGRKVREIAMRLAMSEADLYRKQRVALEAVAKTIMEMEEQAREEVVKS